MRYSTALGLGSVILKWVAGTTNDGHGGGCALGMIYKGGKTATELGQLSAQLPCDCDLSRPIMGSGCGPAWYHGICTLDHAIIHLFNYHVMTKKDWSMEKLIDWVRSVEPADPKEDANATAAAASCEETAERCAVPVLR